MVSDDQGGVIVFWNKYSPGNYIYAQRINSSGNKLWGSSGISLNSAQPPDLLIQIKKMEELPYSIIDSSTTNISKIDLNGNILWSQPLLATTKIVDLVLFKLWQWRNNCFMVGFIWNCKPKHALYTC